MEFRNFKQIGEIGERIAIGELAKYGIEVLLPMSDNLPFDFGIFYNNKIYKCQVKSTNTRTKSDALEFSLTSNNWNKGTKYLYVKSDYDVLILCDLTNIYLLRFDEVKGKSVFTLRDSPPKSNQTKGIHLATDYIISEERLEKVLG